MLVGAHKKYWKPFHTPEENVLLYIYPRILLGPTFAWAPLQRQLAEEGRVVRLFVRVLSPRTHFWKGLQNRDLPCFFPQLKK